MNNDDVRTENTYWSRQIADLIGIGDSTLRKWCRILESHGYRFLRDENERRAFIDHDAVALRYFKELTQDKGVSLDIAAKSIVERFGQEAIHTMSLSAMPENDRYTSDMQRLFEHIQNQEDFNSKLLEELTAQRRYIEESIQRRDDVLMQTIREMLETKKQLAAAQKKWWMFWK